MIQLINAEQLEKATERAKTAKLFVRPTSLRRQYEVENRENGKRYTVNFFVRKTDGARFGHCACPAGERNIPCKHLSVACGYHICREAAKRVIAVVEQLPKTA